MSLINCPECGHEVSTFAKVCQNCGYPIEDLEVVNQEDEANKTYCIINGEKKDVTYFIDFIKKYPSEEYLGTNIYSDFNSKVMNELDISMIRFVNAVDANNGEAPAEINADSIKQWREQNRIREASKIHCPYCKSTNVKKIGAGGRLLSVGTLGLAGSKIGKQWHCNSCKSDF